MSSGQVPIGRIAKFINGMAFKPTDWESEGRKIIRIQNLTDPTKPYNYTSKHVDGKFVVSTDDILVSWSASLGVYRWTEQEPAVLNQHIFKVVPDYSKVDDKYFFYVLAEAIERMKMFLHGSTMQHVNRQEFLDTLIPLPPLAEQQRIADLLSRADRLRRLRRFALEMSDGYLQSVFLEMFGDLSQNRRWSVSKLEKLADVVSGVTKGQRFNGRATVEVPYLRVANVQDGYLDLSEIKTIEALPADVAKYQLQKGDILMTEGGDFDKLGRGAIWHGQVSNCIHQNHIFRVRLDKDKILPQFFGTLLMMQYTKSYFLRASKQTTNLATINMGQLKAFEVPLPPMEIQERFVEVSAQYNRLRAQQQEALRQAEHLFQTLLHRSFQGA